MQKSQQYLTTFPRWSMFYRTEFISDKRIKTLAMLVLLWKRFLI